MGGFIISIRVFTHLGGLFGWVYIDRRLCLPAVALLLATISSENFSARSLAYSLHSTLPTHVNLSGWPGQTRTRHNPVPIPAARWLPIQSDLGWLWDGVGWGGSSGGKEKQTLAKIRSSIPSIRSTESGSTGCVTQVPTDQATPSRKSTKQQIQRPSDDKRRRRRRPKEVSLSLFSTTVCESIPVGRHTVNGLVLSQRSRTKRAVLDSTVTGAAGATLGQVINARVSILVSSSAMLTIVTNRCRPTRNQINYPANTRHRRAQTIVAIVYHTYYSRYSCSSLWPKLPKRITRILTAIEPITRSLSFRQNEIKQQQQNKNSFDFLTCVRVSVSVWMCQWLWM